MAVEKIEGIGVVMESYPLLKVLNVIIIILSLSKL